jgi:diguanylate cyclase (GGDEF)-like protein/PAS domain S-box-containing protein
MGQPEVDPSPLDEARRLQVLADYAILDTSPEGEFDEIVLLAARTCGVPISTVTFVDGQRQWFKARVGLEVGETARDISFCTHALCCRAPLVVGDARADPRFADNPLVIGPPHLVFYAGFPLVSASGAVVGTLTAMDRVPRQLDADQMFAMRVLAHQVVSRLELRSALRRAAAAEAGLQLAKAELEARVEARTQDIERASQAHARAEAMYRKLWETTTDAGLILDEDSIICSANAGVERIFGHPPDALVGQPLTLLQPERLRAGHAAGMRRFLETGVRHVDWRAAEVPGLHADGREIPLEIAFSELHVDGERLFVGLIRDISERKRAAEQISWQASHDSLTGLVNRGEFDRRLRVALESAHVLARPHALLYLDLDQFKIVNDTCGHGAGDELLKQLSGMLSRLLRSSDTLARLGGDEFGVLVEGCPPEPAARLAEKLRRAVSDFSFAWNGRIFSTTVSIGQVDFDASALSVAEIMSKADEACYLAKDSGRNRVHAYTAGDEALAQRHGEMEWVERLRQGMEQDRLVLYAQGIHPVADALGPAEEVEVLLRMRGEGGQVIAPMAFIPAAERYGLMPAVDRWVVRTLFAHIAAQRGAGPSTWSVNLSAATLADAGFVDYVKQQLLASAVPPASLCFEITETAAIANFSVAVQRIEALRALGCRFALDDFGSGMSSFSYLRHLPVDVLKIDGSFVREIADNPVARAMVASINEIGHLMGLRTIAEFVETPEILRELALIGVDAAQGYALSRPAPL